MKKQHKKATPIDERPDAIPQQYWPLEKNRNAGTYDRKSRKMDPRDPATIEEKTIIPTVR